MKLLCFYLFFNFKTQNFLYILIDDSLTGFLKLLLHHFNCVDFLETKIMTKTTDINLISYLKENISSNGILFLQETHFSSKDEMKWKIKFKGDLFFSHGKTNSCGVVIGYTGKRSFKLLKKKNDENGRFLIFRL